MRKIANLCLIVIMVMAGAAAARADEMMAGGMSANAAAEAKAARDEIKATFGSIPTFLKSVPDQALPGAWAEMKALWLDPETALPPKVKELIGLAVAAQIPCKYCVYAHTEFAKLSGASQAEVDEAIVISALTRHWSTFLNGVQVDETKFRAELTKLVDHVKKMMSGKMPPPKQMAVMDHDSAMADIKATFGFVPEFLAKFPKNGLAGAWKELKQVELAPDTAIQPKYKNLISLAVAAQIPCKFCIAAHTEFAKLDGATDAEIGEAIAMASMIRHWSTWLNGSQQNEATFKKEVDALVKMMKKKATGSAR